MYSKLARGHARAFMQSFTKRSTYEDWAYGPRMQLLIKDFQSSSYAKKPGRVLKRLDKNLPPKRSTLEIVSWTRQEKRLFSELITYDPDACITLQGDYKTHEFQDDLLQLNDMLFYADRLGGYIRRGATASITLHAIARLIEREACELDTLQGDVFTMLRLARHISMGAFDTDYPAATYAFLIPFRDGALVAINCPIMAAGQDDKWAIDGLSIRTWLAPEMIRSEMAERMAALAPWIDETFDQTKHSQTTEEDRKEARRILNLNGRPYEPMEPASTRPGTTTPAYAQAAE